MRIKLFSHTDLDGYGCNLLLKLLNDEVECTNCDYYNINEEVHSFLINKKYLNYDRVLITDISVSQEVADLIDELVSNNEMDLLLLDHHVSATYLNKYSWATVDIERQGEKTCGTKMLYDEICNRLDDNIRDKALNIAENIRKYDTWLWCDKYNDIIPKKFNDLFYILGSNRFIDNIYEIIQSYDNENIVQEFMNKYKILLELEEEKIQRYIKSKNKSIFKTLIHDYKVGVVFAEQFISELGNTLSKMNPDCDLIAIINNNAISYRTVKEDIKCHEFAAIFGGGGHPRSAGSQISDCDKAVYIQQLFNIKLP